MRKIFMIVALVTIGAGVLAEDKVISQKLDETVITTENFETSVQETPKNITIITSEDITNKGANTVAEALKGVPGLTITSYEGGEPAFDLRGFGATASQNTLILIDGIPLNNIQGSEVYTSQIPIEMVDKIEVIPSGGAVMYGEGATGGVINIITKSPQNRANYGSFGMEAGSWGTIKGNVNYGTKLTDRFLMDIAYTNYRSEGYRSKTSGEPHSQYDKDDEKKSIWLRGKYLLDNGYLEVNYRYNEVEDYYTGALTKEQFEKDPSMAGNYNGVADSEENSYSLKYITKLNDKFDFMLYGGYDELEYKGDNTSWGGSHYIATQYYIKPQLKYNYGDNSYVIVGGDYKDGKSEDKININAPDKKREAYAGYILNKTSVGNWQFTQGYRAEKINIEDKSKEIDKKKSADSYELGVNYRYSETGSVYLSYVNGYRAPSIQDLGPDAWEGDIKIQETETYELGIKETIGNTYISPSIFYMTTKNEIIFDNTLGGAWNGKNTNYNGEVERKGIQLSMQHYFDKLVLRENISYIEAEATSGTYDGKKFVGVPKWILNLGASYNFTEKLLGNIDIYYQSSAYGSSDYNNLNGKNNEYTTVNANLRYSFDSGLEIYAGVRNLFNEEYCTTFSSPYSYNPADGKSYYAGFKYSF